MNKNELIRNFTWGFVPIILFLIADSWFGVIYGLAVAIGFGLLELIYFYTKEKTIEKFILFDIGLLVLLGGISILLKNDLLFKLKPALMEFILVIILAIHGFTRHPVLFMMARRYFGEVEPAPAQKAMMRMLVRIMAVILLGHVFLIVWAAYFWSREWWAFISGGLFYVIIILMAAGQWMYVRSKRNNTRSGRMIDLCDVNGKIVRQLPEGANWKVSGLFRPAIFIQVFDKKGRLYLAPDDEGRWGLTYRIDLFSGEELPAALGRNGVVAPDSLKPLARYTLENTDGNRLVHLFKLDAVSLANNVLPEKGRYWSVFEIMKNRTAGFFTPDFEQALELMRRLHLF